MFVAVAGISAQETLESEELPPGFVSDGCTGVPDGEVRDCCEVHDLAYFKGGTFSERRTADKRLYKCVKAKGGTRYAITALIMYLGVRVFGTAWLPTKARWGFGKDICPDRIKKDIELRKNKKSQQLENKNEKADEEKAKVESAKEKKSESK